MALVDLTAISGALATKHEDIIQTQINRSVPLLNVMRAKRAWSKDVSWVVRSGLVVPANAAIADGADVTVFNNDTKQQAVLQYTTYHDAFKVSGRAVAGARVTRNPAELEDLFLDEAGDANERLSAALGQHLYIGTGATNQVLGLVATNGALMATGTYAGIDRAVTTQLQGNVLANGGVPRPLTIGLMRVTRKTVYEACGFKPDLIVASPAQYKAYAELMGPNVRYTNEIRLAGRPAITLDAGFEALLYDGIPMIEDQFCPDPDMLWLNSAFVDICFLPDGPSEMNGALGMMQLAGTPDEQQGERFTALTARIQPLAIQGDAMPFECLLYPQIRAKRPNAHAVLTDLAI